MQNYYVKKLKSQQLKLERTFIYLFIVIVIMTPNKGGDRINYQGF